MEKKWIYTITTYEYFFLVDERASPVVPHNQYTSAVEAVSKDAFLGTRTTLSCKISGLAAKATVIWKKGDDIQEGTVEGQLSGDKSQISTLTVDDPQNDEVYTCVVTSGQYTNSASSETIVHINTFCELENAITNILKLCSFLSNLSK